MAKGKNDKWVLLENQNGTSQTFTDHRGNMMTLDKQGAKGAKKQIGLDKLDDKQLQKAMSAYHNLRKISGFKVVFSPTCPVRVEGTPIVKVEGTTSKYNDQQAKADWIRKQIADKKRTANLTTVRLAHLKATQAIKANKAPEQPAPAPVKPVKAPAPVKPAKPARTPVVAKKEVQPVKHDGVDITPETLSAMDAEQFAQVVASLEIAPDQDRALLEVAVLDKLGVK